MLRRIFAVLAVLGLAAVGCGKTEFAQAPVVPPPSIPDTTPPQDVTNLTATAGATSVTLAWTPSVSSDCVGYTITLTPTVGTAITQNVNSGTALGAIVTAGVLTNTTYTVLVQAFDAVPNISAGVNPAAGTVTTSFLQPPTGFFGIPGNGQVTLQWTLSTSTGVTSYVIRRTPPGVNLAPLPATATTTTVTGLTNGTAYTFEIEARDAAGNSSPPFGTAGCPTVSVTPTSAIDTTPPSGVGTIIATVGGGQVTLVWTAATDNVGVASYTVVTRNLLTSAIVSTTSITPASTTIAIVTGLTNGTPYRFTVNAVDFAGNTGPTSTVDATPGNPAVTTAVSSPGGAYRTAIAPNITVSGLINGNPNFGTGVIFYTLDGSNPIVSNASTTGDGETPNTAGATTLVQPNDGTFNPVTLASTLQSTQFSGTVAAGSTTTAINGTFPVDGTIQSGDTFEVTVSGGGPPVGEQRTVANNGVSATQLSIAALSAAPTTTTQYRITRARRFVVIKAFYDPGGTVSPIATSNQAGTTGTFRYFYYGNAIRTFAAHGGMIQPRSYHTSTLLVTGPLTNSVFIAGGERSLAFVEELFDRDTEFFFRGTSAGFPGVFRYDAQAVRLDNASGDVLIVGGREATTGNITNDVVGPPVGALQANVAERFDPVANSYTPVGAGGTGMTARAFHSADVLSAAVTNNRVLVAGGIASTVTGPFTADSTSSATVVDHSVSATLLAAGDIVERVTILPGPIIVPTGEFAVVVRNNSPPVTSLQSVTVSPPFTVSMAGQSFRRHAVNDRIGELYNPATSAWVATSNTLPDRRWGHASTLLQNGLVFIAGGHLETNPLSSNLIERTTIIFDPAVGANGTFRYADVGAIGGGFTTNAARLQSEKFFCTTTLLADGKVLVAGGSLSGTPYFITNSWRNTTLSSTADLFDPSNETVVKVGSMTKGRVFHTATLLKDGRVLIAGGGTIINSTSGALIAEAAPAELYNPLTRTFTATGTMINTRAGHKATLLPDGRVLITGGNGNSALPEVFDPAAGKFFATAGTATGDRTFGGASVLLEDGRLLATGGQTTNQPIITGAGGTSPGNLIAEGEVYDPNLSLFRATGNSMAAFRRFHSMTRLDDGRVLVAGGEGGATATAAPLPLASAEVYNPATDLFTNTAAMSGGRYGHRSIKLNPARLYTAGTATFDGTTTITGTGSLWLTDAVAVGDRIRLDSDGNFFEIASIGGETTLTVRGPIPGGPIPGTVPLPLTGAYTIYSEQPYVVGTASFTFGLTAVSGAGTAWTRTVQVGDLIRPTGAGAALTMYRVASVNTDTSLTLTSAFTGNSVAATTYQVAPPSRVLMIGGGPAGTPLNTGEMWNPVTGLFTTAASNMALGRFAHTATLLNNGFVLIVGGNGNFDRTAELFDPAMNRFRQLSLPTLGTAVTRAARNNHQAVRLPDGNVFLCGGDVAQAVCEVFVADSDGTATTDADGDGFGGLDFTAGTFVQVTASMSVGRVGHTATVLPGASGGAGTFDVLIVGGKTNSAGADATAEIFDYNSGAIATSTFGAAITLARPGMEFHMAELLPGSGNVFILHSHTAQIFFSQ